MVFGERCIVLYQGFNLHATKAQYLQDATDLGLSLSTEECDFTAFDEGPDLPSAAAQKVAAGQSWR